MPFSQTHISTVGPHFSDPEVFCLLSSYSKNAVIPQKRQSKQLRWLHCELFLLVT